MTVSEKILRTSKNSIGKTKILKKSFIPAFCMFVSACGFTPLYSTEGGILSKADETIPEETAKVFVAPIAEHSGQIMRQNLISLLSGQKKADKIYTLNVHNTESIIREQGYNAENIPTRITIGINSAFTLSKDGKVLLSETASAQSSYNVLQSGYATVTAKKALQKQLLSQLSQDIALRISSFLKASLANQQTKESNSEKTDKQLQNGKK